MLNMSMTAKMGMHISPTLLELTRLLALPRLSLYQAVQHELMENPALDEIEDNEEVCIGCDSVVVGGLCLVCVPGQGGDESTLHQADDEHDSLRLVAAPRSTADDLLTDLYASLPASEHLVALAVVGSLDSRGFLRETPQDIADGLGVVVQRVDTVIQLLRDLGPAGIAAHDAQQCLLAQLDALAAEGISCDLARAVLTDYLDDLSAHRFSHIARQLGITAAQVEAVHEFIRKHLWPYPAEYIDSIRPEPDRRHYRTPDLVVREREGCCTVEVIPIGTGSLRLSPVYQELARCADTLSIAERKHVQEFVKRAQMFISNLCKRDSTLQRVGEAIVARQQAFLHYGLRHLVPLTRLDVASELGLHESTVSRVVTDKTALLPNGQLWPLSAFFTSTLCVQDVMRELVVKGPQPLSDQKLAQLLAERGFPVARRTVAKYRAQMQILPWQLR